MKKPLPKPDGPRAYIKRYGRWRDIHSLENLLMAYRHRMKCWKPTFEEFEEKKRIENPSPGLLETIAEVDSIRAEYEAEIRAAENTIAAWKKIAELGLEPNIEEGRLQ